jgi:hypothetical protein
MVSHSKPHPRRSASAPPKREGEAEPGRESGQPRSGARSGGRRPEHGACGPVADRYAGCDGRRATRTRRRGPGPRRRGPRDIKSRERARAPSAQPGSVHRGRGSGAGGACTRHAASRLRRASQRPAVECNLETKTNPTGDPPPGRWSRTGPRGPGTNVTRTGSARRGYRENSGLRGFTPS